MLADYARVCGGNSRRMEVRVAHEPIQLAAQTGPGLRLRQRRGAIFASCGAGDLSRGAERRTFDGCGAA